MHRSSINHLLLAIAAAVVLFACGCERPAAGERAVPTPGDIVVERAMFGAGCFWSVQEKFRTVEGVIATAVGYAGGHAEKPTYEEVCTNRTGHAEVVFIEYDPALVSYEALLEVFWQCHDPTTPNQPGPAAVGNIARRSSTTARVSTMPPWHRGRSWMIRARSSGRSSRRLCPRRPSGGPRTTTSSTFRSVPWRLAAEVGQAAPEGIGAVRIRSHAYKSDDPAAVAAAGRHRRAATFAVDRLFVPIRR